MGNVISVGGAFTVDIDNIDAPGTSLTIGAATAGETDIGRVGAPTVITGSAGSSLTTGAITCSTVAPSGNVTFAIAQATPTVGQTAKGTDVACNDMSCAPQAPFASATGTNRTGGNFLVSLASPTNSGTVSPLFKVNTGASTYISAGQYANTTAGALWGGTAAPSSTNFVVYGSSTVNYLNAPSGGTLALLYAGATPLLTMGGTAPTLWAESDLTATTGTTTLSAAQQQTYVITYTATLSGDVTVEFPNAAGNWLLDCSAVVLGGHHVNVKSGSTTVQLTDPATTRNLYPIHTRGSNRIAIG